MDRYQTARATLANLHRTRTEEVEGQSLSPLALMINTKRLLANYFLLIKEEEGKDDVQSNGSFSLLDAGECVDGRSVASSRNHSPPTRHSGRYHTDSTGDVPMDRLLQTTSQTLALLEVIACLNRTIAASVATDLVE